MALRKSLNWEFGNIEGVERKENFREEEEEDFPALLYVTDSKAVSKQTTYPLWAWSNRGGDTQADMLEDCVAAFHLGFANACLSTDYKKQHHYPENKETQI